jgi:hypothetical protein
LPPTPRRTPTIAMMASNIYSVLSHTLFEDPDASFRERGDNFVFTSVR